MILSILSSAIMAIFIGNDITTTDTLRTLTLEEVSIVSQLKENGTSRQQPASITTIEGPRLSQQGMSALKGIGTLAPNFFMPDYGSKQSGAIYMRGIGSRIGTPTVGLYVDNVAYYEKSAFDFSFYDIAGIEIMRGPQSTLYGRNAMSGIIKVVTRNPLMHEGTDLKLGYATGDNHRQVALTHYHHINDRLAFSAGGFYDGGDGFFKNTYTGRKADGIESAGGRIRAIFKPANRLTFDANISYEYSDEDSYPYFYTGTIAGESHAINTIGTIDANRQGYYHRGLFNASLNTEYKAPRFTLNSVTAYQNVNDCMFMDQDFTHDDIYTLTQKQLINTLSEEIIVKSSTSGRWNWLTGINAFAQWQRVEAPVVFMPEGILWLNKTINTNANKYMPKVTVPMQGGQQMTMSFLFSDNIACEPLSFNNDFHIPTVGIALFHQSTLKEFLGIEGLSASLGMRLDYEKMKMNTDAWYSFSHSYSLQGNLVTPFMNRDIDMVSLQEFTDEYNMKEATSNDYLEILPKLSVKYDFKDNLGNIYATVSRGYRSGGYNPQNISDVLRSRLQSQMMTDVRDVTVPVLMAQPTVPADTKESIIDILNTMAEVQEIDAKEVFGYKPEYAWNYEIGTHLNLLNGKMLLDMGAFLNTVRDMQLSKIGNAGLGRIIINAGRSRSMGIEASTTVRPMEGLQILVGYGFTQAVFRDYTLYNSATEQIDCRGKHVPYVPQHTINADIAYTWSMRQTSKLKSLTIGCNASAAGRIYWDETNEHYQNMYGTIGARINASFNNFDVTLWGRNLTNTHYDTFWFSSMNNGFRQKGKPLQIGINANLHF